MATSDPSVVPTTFMPLHLLSIPSILSTFATVLLIGIVVIDGLYLPKAPGSIRDPMPTSLGPEMKGMNWLGGIGLVLAGFGGHAVIPSIAKDMRNHASMERVFNIAFVRANPTPTDYQLVAGTVAFIAGAAGYLMFGDTVSDEITRDLMKPKYGYPVALNLFAVWMIVVNPLTKFGLCSRPLNVAVEGFLNLAPAPRPIVPPQHHRRMSVTQAMSSAISTRLSGAGASDYLSDESGFDPTPKSPVSPFFDAVDESAESRKGFWRIVSRSVITLGCTATAILLPGFERVMAFLGSFSSFLICIILPVSTSNGSADDSLDSISALPPVCSRMTRLPSAPVPSVSCTLPSWQSVLFSWALEQSGHSFLLLAGTTTTRTVISEPVTL